MAPWLPLVKLDKLKRVSTGIGNSDTASVPEPSTGAILLSGFAVLGFIDDGRG